MLEFVTVQFCNQADFFISMLTAIEFLIFSAKKSFNLKKIFKKLIINLIHIYIYHFILDQKLIGSLLHLEHLNTNRSKNYSMFQFL